MSSISSIQQVLIDHLLWVVLGALGNTEASTFEVEEMAVGAYISLLYVAIKHFNAILDTSSFDTMVVLRCGQS